MNRVGPWIFDTPDGVTHRGLDDFDAGRYLKVHKFGYNAATGTSAEDIWDAGGIHPGIQTAAATTVVSSEAADAAAGTGARTVWCQGLDADYNLQSETVTLNGDTAVNLTKQYICIFRARIVTAGSGGINAGDLTFAIDGTTVAQINAGNGQTLMAWFVIPAGYTAYVTGWDVTAGKSANAAFGIISFRARPFGGPSGGLTKGTVSVHTYGGHVPTEYPIAQAYPEKTTLWFKADSTSAAISVSARFDMLMIPND